MRRYIVLLLITGILWAQTDFDTLVLKDGTTYLGEYSKIEKEIVYFKPQNAFAFQPVPIKLIKRLKLKDSHYIIDISSKSERQAQTALCCVVFTGFLVYVVMSGLGSFNYSGGLWEPGQGTVVHIRLKEGM